MPTVLQLRRGTTAEHSSFTGAEGEVTVNTSKDTLVVHDGATAGGFEVALADLSNTGLTATVTEINYVDGVTSAIQTQLDAKAPLASPTLTGTPAAPTAAAGTNTTQIATTAFVTTAVANIIDSAPGALDTLNELAAALGDDANFSTTVTNSIATKLNASDYTAADVLDKIKTVDGASSGLDADLLDGQQGSYYRVNIYNSAGTLLN